jgi:DNA-binding response OmpR family regulator
MSVVMIEGILVSLMAVQKDELMDKKLVRRTGALYIVAKEFPMELMMARHTRVLRTVEYLGIQMR